MSTEQLSGVLPLVLIVLVFWFLVIRPARKKQQEMSRVQASVDVGAEVMLSSGVFGTVVSVAHETMQLEISPGTSIKVARQAVVRVVEPHDNGPHDGPNDDPDHSANVVDEQ